MLHYTIFFRFINQYSCSSSCFFISVPTAKPSIEPFDLITLWHGTTISRLFLLHAFPTALAAFGCPISVAISLYVLFLPNGILLSSFHTSSWNCVPQYSIGTENIFRLSSKYSEISVAACINNIGPGLSDVGPTGNFGSFSIPSKIVLMIDMLAGRLELYPLILLLNPSVYIDRAGEVRAHFRKKRRLHKQDR